MRKHLTPLFTVLLSSFLVGCGHSQSIEAQQSLKDSLAEINQAEIGESLQFLSSDALEGRKTGTPGIDKAADYLEDRLRTAGLKPFYESFRDSFEVEGQTGFNVVAFKEGTDLKEEYVIIGAHYDHVGKLKAQAGDSIANGANDNATGTTTVLELAEFFANKDTRRSLLFVLFSAEEMGLVGSEKLASRLKESEVQPYFMFNVEMVGVPMNNRTYDAYLTGYELSNLAEEFNKKAGKEVLGFLPEAQKYQLFKRSDNYPFYEAFGIPAHTISTFDFTNYDFYHHVEDEYQRMDPGHMENLIKNIAPPLLELINQEGQIIKMKPE